MKTTRFPRSALIPLLLIPGYVLAEQSAQSADQLKTDLTSSEARIQQTVVQGQQRILDQNVQMDGNLKELLAQQDKTRQAIQDLKNLQQQLSRQMQQVVRSNMSDKDKASCPVVEPGLTTADGKLFLGESEWVYVEEANGAFQTRVDTGAATSSISATDITVFEREGKRWVKFKMPLDGGKSLDLEAPFVRYVRIKQASADGTDRRPVVRLTIQIGSLTEKAEFSLKDRSEMDFSLLLGREFIKDVAVVDVAREFIQPKPDAALNVTSKKEAAKAAADKAAADKAAADKADADKKPAADAKATDKKATDTKKAADTKKPAADKKPAAKVKKPADDADATEESTKDTK